MDSFKEAYINYVNEQEMVNKAPEGRVFYEYCRVKKDDEKRGKLLFGSKLQFVKHFATVAVLIMVITVTAKTGVVGYAYEAVSEFVGAYILKSKDVNVKEMVIEEDKEVFEKNFMSIEQVANAYDIEFMQSSLAYEWANEYVVAIGYGTKEKINGVRIIAPYYIMGDLPVLESELVTPDETAILNPLSHGIYGNDLRENEKYQTPVYLSMFVNVSDKDMESGNQTKYEGVNVVSENYVSSVNGMKAIITATEFNIGENISGLNPMVKAFITKDDVQYHLEGRVTVETMKEIIDSFAY